MILAVMGREGLALRAERAVDAGAARTVSTIGGRGFPPRLAERVMAAILALLAARFFWLLLAPLPLPAVGALAAAALPTAEVARLEAKSPFGAAPPSAETAPKIAETAPDISETALDLTLTGVWADEEGGSAIIKLTGGKQKRFVIGDEIIDGVKLEVVYPDQIIIRRAGVREALRFETKEAGDASAEAPPPGARAQDAARQRANRDRPAAIRAAEIGGLASIFRVAPGADDNGKRTIELYASRNRRAFERFGLKDGDRLVSINGHPPPANPAALSSVLSNLQRRSSASLVIERGGEEIPITISLGNTRVQ